MKEALSKLGGRERSMLIVGICFLLGVLIDRTIVKPMQREFDRIALRIDQVERELKHSLGVIAKADVISRGAAALDAMPSRAETIAEQNARFKQTIERLANANNMLWSSIGNRDPVGGPYETYFVDVTDFEISEKDLVGFLHDIRSGEGESRMMRAEAIRIQADKTTPGKVAGNLSVSQAVVPR